MKKTGKKKTHVRPKARRLKPTGSAPTHTSGNPRILELVSTLVEKTGGLVKKAHDLRDRLGMVLSPTPGVKPIEATASGETTGLGVTIAARIDDCEELDAILSDILNRLEV